MVKRYIMELIRVRYKVFVGKFEILLFLLFILVLVKVFIIYVVWVKYKCILFAIKFYRFFYFIWRVIFVL